MLILKRIRKINSRADNFSISKIILTLSVGHDKN